MLKLPFEPERGARHVSTEELFKEHAQFVARFLTRLGVPTEALDDAVQEVFLVVHRRGGYVAGPAKPTSYLATIAVNTAAAQRRQARKRRERCSEQDLDTLSGGSDPARELETRQDLRRLDCALERLDAPLRATLLMADGEGESCVAIADATRVPLGTVYWRLDRARKKFREALIKVDARGRRAGLMVLIPAGDALDLLRTAWPARDVQYDVARGFTRLRGQLALAKSTSALWFGKYLLGAGGLAGLAAVAALHTTPAPAPQKVVASAPPTLAEPILVNTRAEPSIVDIESEPPPPTPRRARHGARRAEAESANVRNVTIDSVATSSVSTSKLTTGGSKPAASAKPAPANAEQPKQRESEPRRISEAEQLARAEQLLARDPDAALAAVRAIDPSSSYLHEERDYIELMATLRSGERKAGQQLARKFLNRYPTSAFARVVQSAAGIRG